jgi:hypothetical protein
VDGFWDYDLAHRGVLFAPVAFNGGVPAAGFVFTPTVALNCDVFTDHLFCQPQCNCYCFGDYYAANQLQAGIYPWFAFHMSHFGYDPLYACCSWQHRHDMDWHKKLIAIYRLRRDHAQSRPPHTYAALMALSQRAGSMKTPTLAVPLSKWAARPGASSLRFEKVSEAGRERIRKSAQSLGELATSRLRHEQKSLVREPSKLAQAAPAHTLKPPERGDHPLGQPGKLTQAAPGHTSRLPGDDRHPIGQSGKFAQAAPKYTPTVFDQGHHPAGQPGKLTQPAPARFTPLRNRETTAAKTRPTPGLQRTGGPQFKMTPRPNLSTVRTPPVVPRRPTTTAGGWGPPQNIVRQHPTERLTDTNYVPHPATLGRPQPTPRGRRG